MGRQKETTTDQVEVGGSPGQSKVIATAYLVYAWPEYWGRGNTRSSSVEQILHHQPSASLNFKGPYFRNNIVLRAKAGF